MNDETKRSGFNIEDLRKLSENSNEFAEYVAARLQGKLFHEKPVEPLVNSRIGEIPEDFLIEACKGDDKESTFKNRLGKIVEKLLLDEFRDHNINDEADREYLSRLIYLAEHLHIIAVHDHLYFFAKKYIDFSELTGAHTENINTQLLRILAQIQPPNELMIFWFDRFHQNEYIRYAQPLFTGLRRSSLEMAACALPRLFVVASQYPKYLDKNRALRPLVKTCEDNDESAQHVARGFGDLTLDDQKFVISGIYSLDLDLMGPLSIALIRGIIIDQRYKSEGHRDRTWKLFRELSNIVSINDYIPGKGTIGEI